MKVKILSMDWVDKFQCIGAECPLTCCSHWEITISNQEIEQYEKMEHPFGKEIVKVIDKEKKCMQLKDRKCQMLTEEGWCKIVQQCGPEYLSFTCTVFPRLDRFYGDTVECTVGLTCPVVAEYLLDAEPIGFGFREEELPDYIPKEIDYEVYDSLSLSRTHLIELLQSYENQFHMGKLYIVLQVMEKVKELMTSNALTKSAVEEILNYYEDTTNRATVFSMGEELAKKTEIKLQSIKKLISIVKLLINDEQMIRCPISTETMYQYLEVWNQDREQLYCDIKEFSIYYQNQYSAVFSNYFVYALFMDWIELDNRKFGNKIMTRIIEYAVMQIIAMVVWKEKGEVSKRDLSVVISSLERGLQNSEGKNKQIVEMLQKNGINQTAEWLLIIPSI